MLRRLVRFSLHFRGVVIALACLTLGYGLWALRQARYDVYPEFAPPQVTIQTEAPGLSPEEVEALVTRPIESAVNGVAKLESIRSQSVQGLSVITIVFEEHTDIFRARQMVGERLTEAAEQLPQGIKAPAMAPLTSAASLVLIVGLTSEQRGPMDLRTFADWVLRPRLLGVPGVAKVTIFGGEVRQLQVQVRPERLAAFDLSVGDVLAAARASTGVRGAGFVETPAQRIVIQTQGQALTAANLGEVLVAHSGGVPVRLKDVARVVDAPEPKIGGASINGKPGVMMQISSQYGANTLEVSDALEAALEEMRPAIAAQGITLHSHLFRPAEFIRTAIHNISRSLLVGGILVAVVLSLFLFNLRTAFISLTAIPLSLLVAAGILHHMGITLNTLTLGGLAIAIGEVVDDAIIDVENIFRRLRENCANGSPRSPLRVVLDASVEVRSAVVYATFVVALVFLPVLTMTGVQGRLFAPLAIAYILAILASLVIALTLTPALSLAMLPVIHPELGRQVRATAVLAAAVLGRTGQGAFLSGRRRVLPSPHRPAPRRDAGRRRRGDHQRDRHQRPVSCLRGAGVHCGRRDPVRAEPGGDRDRDAARRPCTRDEPDHPSVRRTGSNGGRPLPQRAGCPHRLRPGGAPRERQRPGKRRHLAITGKPDGCSICLVPVQVLVCPPATAKVPPLTRSLPLTWSPAWSKAMRTPRSLRKRAASVTSGSTDGWVIRLVPGCTGGEQHRGHGQPPGSARTGSRRPQ